MGDTKQEVLTIIIAVVLILVIIAVFFLLMLIYFNNKKIQNSREKEKLKKDYDQALLQTQLEVQEQTMHQISLEIHDNIGQVLSLVNLNLKTLVPGDTEKVNDTSLLVNKAITDLRSLSKSLNPESIGKKDLAELLREELNLLERSGRFVTNLEVEDAITLPSNQLVILYRMIQEVLNNIIKHSEATAVNAIIKKQRLTISDNGKGFLNDGSYAGLGLNNLRQRGKVIGAAVIIESTINKGTSVTFSIDNL
jgi:signal transduction histidine kinase